MDTQYHYATVSEAIEALRNKGYTMDFNLSENCIVCDGEKFGYDDFEITDIYRYEGDSDPADEAAVYAIKSLSGLKGVLVTGYGTALDAKTTAILKRLHKHSGD